MQSYHAQRCVVPLPERHGKLGCRAVKGVVLHLQLDDRERRPQQIHRTLLRRKEGGVCEPREGAYREMPAAGAEFKRPLPLQQHQSQQMAEQVI